MTLLFGNKKTLIVDSGRLVIPLRRKDGFSVFVPCTGLGDDNVPQLVVDMTAQDLMLQPQPSMFRERQGVSVITLDKKCLDWALSTEQDINEHDFVRVRSAHYEVLGSSLDIYKPQYNAVGFTRDFLKSANSAPYFIIKPLII